MTNADCQTCGRTVAVDALTALATLPVEGGHVQTPRPTVLGLLCSPCLHGLLAAAPALLEGAPQ